MEVEGGSHGSCQALCEAFPMHTRCTPWSKDYAAGITQGLPKYYRDVNVSIG
jgi:hypothetical protein